jgi:hypothetical protein
MQGEEQNLKNLRNAIKEAERIVGVGSPEKRVGSINGQSPKFNSGGKTFSETETGQEIAKEMFGDNSFTNNTK